MYACAYFQKMPRSEKKILFSDSLLVDLQAVSGVILQQALCTGTVLVKKPTLLHAELLKKMWYNQKVKMGSLLERTEHLLLKRVFYPTAMSSFQEPVVPAL